MVLGMPARAANDDGGDRGMKQAVNVVNDEVVLKLLIS